ncbi:LmbE family protein [Pseudalgibacter alginicilyticus]|uniref:LmbE family protein n=1 Tax=Pseudalgibacter alginicilyticus TaxID=1736674 RepID=A0A0P0CKW4_9FLAO|nr:PIG-L family deacetylase [Pseudalgibacter alginicilyticus]ALJ06875.1 LmbE family protein [Pseudalgibacter alginicilyticus]
MQKRLLFLILIGFISFSTQAQHPQKPNASEIYQSIQKLNFLGSVLYVAAHPDDENTRLISYMANHVNARTAYLSLTRGDGGQNLIGPEIREQLGVIRTQELLGARRIDGGEQLFTRANDFGFSKHPDETLTIWNKEEILSDVVLAIRKFKPDVIINRFDHRSSGNTHGHHTTSAILSVEAFDLANNNSAYPDQLKNVDVWQPKRVFFNPSWRFYGSQEKLDEVDKSNFISLDLGVYYASSGLSNTEIAALSRSMHASQGFGNTGTRGELFEYLELIKGDFPQDKLNIFEGIDTSWSRIEGGQAIESILNQVQKNYNFNNPSASIKELVRAYQLIQNLNNEHWKQLKSKEIKNIIAACAGLYLEASSSTNHTTNNETIKINIEAINRSHSNIVLENYITSNKLAIQKSIQLKNNIGYHFSETITIEANQAPTTPYWLSKKGTLGMYHVDNPLWIGLPETPKPNNIVFNLMIEGTPISYSKPIVYKTNDPVKGEVYKPFEIIPEASAKISEKVIIFENTHQKEISVTVKAGRNNLEGYIEISHPNDWKIYPQKQKILIPHKGEEQKFVFTITPPIHQSEGYISPIVSINDKQYSKELIEIDYNHIPFQTILLPSESKMVRLDIKKKGENIAYIEGAGDVVPESLRQIGYNVTILKPESITPETLSSFDAVVIGIRAYNTVETLKFKQQFLFDFVANGGNMVVQYNTNRGLLTNELAPYDLTLSRDRVTDENADVTFLAPNHPLLNYPNKITKQDFEDWKQERGLYFPSDWDKAFTPILSMSDKGESAKKGSLIVAKYGKGYYIYTGLSFFREFPEGVSGAYRLFANILSIGKGNINTKDSK